MSILSTEKLHRDARPDAASSPEELAREWISSYLPDCPFCTAPKPWIILERVYSGEKPRTSFRCVRCNGVLTTATEVIMSPDYDGQVRLVVDKAGSAKHSYRTGSEYHPSDMAKDAGRRTARIPAPLSKGVLDDHVRGERIIRGMEAERRVNVRRGMGWIVAGLALSMLTSMWSATLDPYYAMNMAPVIAGLGALWSLLVLGGAVYIWWKL